MACLALCKDGTRCRNWARLVLDHEGGTASEVCRDFVCGNHKNYFANPAAFRKNILTGWGLFFEYHHSRAIALEEWMNHGLIEFVQEDFNLPRFKDLSMNALPHQFVARYGFLFAFLLANQPSCDLWTWNPVLWEVAISWIWSHYWSYGLVNPRQTLKKICMNQTRPDDFFRILLRYKFRAMTPVEDPFDKGGLANFINDLFESDKTEEFRSLWSAILSEPAQRDFKALLLRPADAENLGFRFLTSEVWTEYHKFVKDVCKRKARDRVEIFKEDLMAYCWHPDRFVRWCLDEEEKKDMRGMWSDFTG